MAHSTLTLETQTAYAELVERTAAAAFDEQFGAAGGFVSKTVRGRRYWYFQSGRGEARAQTYVGPETDELLERIEHHRTRRDDARERRALVAMLVRSAHLPAPDRRIGGTIAALQKAGVFRLRAVLVGTLAYQTYPGLLGARLPHGSMQTSDIDIAQDRGVSLALDDATPPPLETLGALDASFRAIPSPHDSRRSTSYHGAHGVRVDFLVPNTGPESDAPQMLPALATDAQPLRFLDYLIREPARER